MSNTIDVSLVEKMKACEQMPGVSVLEHGLLVEKRYLDLIAFIRDGEEPRLEWRMPDWILHPAIKPRLLDERTMREYIVYHDCGKPFCLVTGDDGKRHFPNHAEVSRKVWLSFGGDQTVADLIGMDMDIHLLKEDGVAEFAKRPQAIPLLLTGLSEIHANAEMFGGIDSVSFKIKWKQINKRGKSILRHLES